MNKCLFLSVPKHGKIVDKIKLLKTFYRDIFEKIKISKFHFEVREHINEHICREKYKQKMIC